jgi:hypothetical protein
MTLEQLLHHTAHLFTAYADYSHAKDAMTLATPTAEIIFDTRIATLPGLTIPPFALVLKEGQRIGVWDIDVDANRAVTLVVMRWIWGPHDSFVRRMEWLRRHSQR